MVPDQSAPSTYLLEPLDVAGLREPFSELCTPPLLSFDNDITPSSLDATLPTPGSERAPLDMDDDVLPWPFNLPELQSNIIPPPTPLLKDIDSFTEGTAKGSFDFSLDSSSFRNAENDAWSIMPPRVPESVAFSPESPSRSIETWRDDVLRKLKVGRVPASTETCSSYVEISEFSGTALSEWDSDRRVGADEDPFCLSSVGPALGDCNPEHDILLHQDRHDNA